MLPVYGAVSLRMGLFRFNKVFKAFSGSRVDLILHFDISQLNRYP